MNATDIILVLILAGAFLIGFFQGVVRGLLALAAWVVAFVLGANLWGPVGDYLASQWTSLDADYVHTLAFGLTTVAIFALGMVLILVGAKGPRGFTSYPLLDDFLGGVLGVALAILICSSVIVMLGTFYGPLAPGAPSTDVEWSAQLHEALSGSVIARLLADTIVPLMGTILGAVMPEAIREQMD